MGKKTEELRGKLEKALDLWKDRTEAEKDAYADVTKNNKELGKICWEDNKDAAWLKRKIKCDKDGAALWSVYNMAKKNAEKAKEDSEEAQKNLSIFLNKKMDDGKLVHALKAKLNKLKTLLK